ncbi:unnamed protein product [Rangifer tarandus platyrhynchus]|uniref:Uncharacterized protein n=1 Tax=Rangifer tarandus platyrhynchus TaxID=3082113 RepID=A0ABN8ZNK1_RANTA|nr:unnamed protein product [Rangifer tarandus platyrhynchus]
MTNPQNGLGESSRFSGTPPPLSRARLAVHTGCGPQVAGGPRRSLGARACARSPSLAQRFPGQGLASSSPQSDGALRCHLSQPWPSSSVRWASSDRPGVVGGDQPRRGCMVLGGLLS